MRQITSDRGSVFYQCLRSATDPSFPKYPRLPVVRCGGYEPLTKDTANSIESNSKWGLPRRDSCFWLRLLQTEFLGERLPLCVDRRLRLRIHHNFIGPRSGETLASPLARGVDTHLRSEVRQPASVIQGIDWAERELNIALRVDVVECLQHNIAEILHVHVFVHDNNAFREHRLSERPDGVHHLASLPWVRLFDRNDHQVVEDTFHGHVDVDQFGDSQLH